MGGTKIAAVLMEPDGGVRATRRVPTPSGDYNGTVRTVAGLVRGLEDEAGLSDVPVGVGTPGAISPATGLLKNANSVCLNDQPLGEDLEAALQRPVRLANDADCLAVSEATDGAAAGVEVVFAVILGTGVGGGIVIRGRPLAGLNAIAGEWGHNPLPWPRDDERPGPACWCGQHGCIETWLSGPGLAADYQRRGGESVASETVVERAEAGEALAEAALGDYEDRLARGLATVINIVDPDVIVLGGGLSRIDRLYRNVPRRWGHYVFSDRVDTRLLAAKHGDASGVRGAAWLWPGGHNG